MPGTLAPVTRQTVEDQNGNPVVGGRITTYLAGTTILAITYTDYLLTTPNTTPIIHAPAGPRAAELTPGLTYKFVYATASGVPLYTDDFVPATPGASGIVDIAGVAGEPLAAGQVVYLSDGSGGKTAGQW